jgi:transcriptional regulator with XRE-family HTH domain
VAFSRHDRKAALYRSGKSGKQIADELGVSPELVSAVIAGRRVDGPSARRVMERLAEIFGVPIDEVFPGTTANAS